MLIRAMAAMLASTATVPPAAAGADQPRAPLPVFEPASVTITRNGARSNAVSGDETAALCAEFKLTKADVRQFMVRAKRVSEREYEHDLDQSRCYAAGQVAFADGTRARWWIDLTRRGLIVLNNGRRMHFHCAACTSPRYDVPYDPDIDG